jgi:hypothetical protein
VPPVGMMATSMTVSSCGTQLFSIFMGS